MMRFVALLLLIPCSAHASTLDKILIAVHADSQKIREEERCFFRYVVWPDEGPKREQVHYMLTHAQANLRSTTGSFYPPVRVMPNVYRLDVRKYGWDKRLNVWERFAAIDPYFHMKLVLLEHKDYITYWPGGEFDSKQFAKGPFTLKRKPGDELFVPGAWVDPLLKTGDSVFSYHDDLRKQLLTESPVLFGPWWFAQTARQLSPLNKDNGVGPYNFLGIKDRDSMFKLIGIDEAGARERFAAWHALIEGGKSGISQQGRIVVLMRGNTGFTWGTLDVFKEEGRSVLKRNLLPGEAKHDAEEWLFHIPNGLQGEALFNAKGVTQASAPPEIGGDKSALNIGNDPRVHTGLCMRCHGVKTDGIQPLDDWVRKTHKLTGGKGFLFRNLKEDNKTTLDSLYFRDIERHIAADRAEYAFAVANLTVSAEHPNGMTVAQFTKFYVEEGWNRYVEERVTLERAAAYMFVKPGEFKERLFKYNADRGGGDLVTNVFVADTPGTLSIAEFESSYGYLQMIMRGLKIPDIAQKVK